MAKFAGENPIFIDMMRQLDELQAKHKLQNQQNLDKMKEQTYRDVMATQGVVIPFTWLLWLTILTLNDYLNFPKHLSHMIVLRIRMILVLSNKHYWLIKNWLPKSKQHMDLPLNTWRVWILSVINILNYFNWIAPY